MEFNKSVLVLTHSNYLNTDAGVEKIIQDQQKLFLKNGYNFVVVYPIRKIVHFIDGVHEVTTSKYGLIVNGKFKKELIQEEFFKLLEIEGLTAVLIHELVTFKKNQSLFDFFDKVNCPIYYYVHDYAMVCYSHTLMRNNKEFCGSEPLSWNKCRGCKYYIQGKMNIIWQNKFVERYPKITYIFPSKIVKDVWQETFHVKNQLMIIPNTKFGNGKAFYTEKEKNEKLRIAFIGYGRIEKGWKIWEKVCKKFDQKYDLYVLGEGECEGKMTKVPVSVSKDGPNAMIDAIKKYQIDIAFLWSTRPETYSYTFYESYVAGGYIVTSTQSGNICAMTRDFQCGSVFENEEELYEYLSCEEMVRKSIKDMHTQNREYPTSLENNDMIFEIIRG